MCVPEAPEVGHRDNHITLSDPQSGVLCRALAGILPQEQLQAVLGKLCGELVVALDISTPASLRCVPAAMQALSSIGRLVPNIFAEHAASVAEFVLGVRQWQALLSNCDAPVDNNWLLAKQTESHRPAIPRYCHVSWDRLVEEMAMPIRCSCPG